MRRGRLPAMDYLEELDSNASGFGELYDELPLWSAPFGLMLLDRVPLKGAPTILDVGAGTGWLTLELAGRCGAGSRIIAVDPWKPGMDRLRRKLEHRRLKNVVLLEQDAATIELPGASVDVIVSNLGINNFENPGAVLRACFRAARPRAALLLTTNLAGHMAEFYDAYRATLIEMGQSDRLPLLEEHVRHRGTPDSIAKMLGDAGFEVLETAVDYFRMRFTDGSSLLRHHFIRLGFVQRWKSIATAGAVEKTFEALERRLNALADRQGELALTIPMACIVARRLP